MMNAKDLRIDTNEIRQYSTNATTYERGRAYWQDGRVKNIQYDPDEDGFQAIVKGSQTYHVWVGADTDGELIADCTCPAFETYPGFCKHVTAVLFGIQNEQQADNSSPLSTAHRSAFSAIHRTHHQQPLANASALQERERGITDQLIRLMDTYQTQSTGHTDDSDYDNRQTLQIEYILHLRRSLHGYNTVDVELRVGPHRLYVVRNLASLLHKISAAETHFFTKNFSYDPQTHRFSETDRHLIALLHQAVQQQAFYGTRPVYHRENERYVTVPPHLADQVLGLLSQCRTVINVDQTTEAHAVEWKEGIPPFTYDLQKSRSGAYTLSMAALQSAIFMKDYQYIYEQGTFYKVPSQLFKLLEDMAFSLADRDAIMIGHDQIDQVISSIVPRLNQAGRVNIAADISDQIIAPSLAVIVRIDKPEDHLLVTMEYHYGDIVIHPLKEDETSSERSTHILMRDTETETTVMNIIENSPLKWNGKHMYLRNDSEMAAFLLDTLPHLERHCQVYMTAVVKGLLFDPVVIQQPHIDMNADNNLLEVSFSVDGIDDHEVQQLLHSLVEKKRYYRLSSGAFVSLEDQTFQSLGNLFDVLGIGKAHINGRLAQTSAVRGLQMEQILEDEDQSFKLGKQFRELLTHMKHPEDLEFAPPERLASILRDYQVFGFQWLKTLAHYRFGGILADDMGLGKTLQSIAYILSEKEANDETDKANDREQHRARPTPTLIVAPAALVFNWKKECHKFAPELDVATVTGTKQERIRVLKRIDEFDVLITSYPLIRRDYELYREHTFQTLFLDEAQAIKNDQTQTAQAVKKLSATNRFALSGTPIENKLDELWSIFQVIIPGLFPGKRTFNNLSHEQISRMCKPFVLRRLKSDVLHELPDKIETLHATELTTAQKQVYLAYLEKIQSEATQSLANNGLQHSRMQILAGLTRLRQICCHPGTFLENYTGDSGKLQHLLDVIHDSLANGRRLLIFSQFTSMLSFIRQALDKRGYAYFYIDGHTKPEERVSITERFNEGEHDLCLISLKAGGTGLNLTGADTVILYDLWWNPAVDQQAIDRAHRIGQKNVVQVIRLITEGTIEERIYELQQKKQALIENVIQPGEAMLTGLSEEDIRHILDI